MGKPAKPARWADDGVSVPGRVEPSEAKKDAGFANGEKPSAGEHNYQLGHLADWIQYLENFEISQMLHPHLGTNVDADTRLFLHGKRAGATPTVNRWAALGINGTVEYSNDLVTWTPTAYALGWAGTPQVVLFNPADPDGLANLGGYYMIGSGPTRINHSDDAITWTAVTSTLPGAQSWTEMAYGKEGANDVFAAVATDGRFEYWLNDLLNNQGPGQAFDLASPTDLLDITYAPGINRWCIVGASGLILTAEDSDLTTWTTRTPDAGYAGPLQRIHWSPRHQLFIASATNGTDGEIQTSPDGITWTQRVTGSAPFRATKYLRELRGVLIMAVRDELSNSVWGVVYSKDGGVTWSTFQPHFYFNADANARESFITDFQDSHTILSLGSASPLGVYSLPLAVE